MGRVAVRDLVERTDHDVVIGELDPTAGKLLSQALGGRPSVRRVDVADAGSLSEALADYDVVVNATLMRYAIPVTSAAIRAGRNLIDLGAYYRDTLKQLALDGEARAAGVLVVPGCGVAPGLTNLLVKHASAELETVDEVRINSYTTHPMFTSPGIVYTKLDATTGTSVMCINGQLVERPSFGHEELVEFAEPYGWQRVHLAPHPEPVTIPRYIDVDTVVYKVGYPPEEEERLKVLLELGFDSSVPIAVGPAAVAPRDVAAALIGRGTPSGTVTANVKRIVVSGRVGDTPATVVCDFAVESDSTVASAVITGAVAAIAADAVTAESRVGVVAPEGIFSPKRFLDALETRGFAIQTRRGTVKGPESTAESTR